jgi:hypothetical protein
MFEATVIIFGCVFFYYICESRLKIIEIYKKLEKQNEFNRYVCDYFARQLSDEKDLEGRDEILKDIQKFVNSK